jgi:hypothetical protein
MTTSSGTPESPVQDGDSPSLRQKLHWATGDRDEEAKALADRADGEISEEDAKVAVNRAHGDSPEPVRTDGSIASPEDAEEVRDERVGTDSTRDTR